MQHKYYVNKRVIVAKAQAICLDLGLLILFI